MKDKKNLILTLLGVVILIVVTVGFTYAYFTTKIDTTGSGGTAEGETTTLENTELKLEPLEGAVHYEYPGGTGYTGTKVTATNKNPDDTTKHYVDFKLVLEYTNPTSTVLNYKIYESSTPLTGEPTCTLNNTVVNGAVQYKYNCTELNYGTELGSGTLEANKTTKTSLTIPYVLNIADNSTAKYYYVVVDYPDNGTNQSTDQGKTITFTIKTTADNKFRTIAASSNRTSTKMLAELQKLNSGLTSSEGEINFAEPGDGFFDGLRFGTDDDGTTYYFRGIVDNNWVRIGNMYFRIIRINGDGTVRLIYSGTTAPTEDEAVVMTGEGTQIGTSSFNYPDYDNAHVGYMYGSPETTTYADTHKNTNNSTIKEVVDAWYAGEEDVLSKVVDVNAGFCGDRKIASVNRIDLGYGTDGYGYNETAYAPVDRFYDEYMTSLPDYKPVFTCSGVNDLYTSKNSNKGNKALDYPVGLITIDELIYAGANFEGGFADFYLYTEQYYWTMSPHSVYGGTANVFAMYVDRLSEVNTADDRIGVRPVINLKSNLTWSGTGEWNNPFTPSL